jgi:hypothetical protein
LARRRSGSGNFLRSIQELQYWRQFTGEAFELHRGLEEELGIKAQKQLLPLQGGDVPDTYAGVSELAVGYCPRTRVKTGVANFIRWCRDTYRV